ncbi:hypothetical protein D9M69_624200 [compost metagenome]
MIVESCSLLKVFAFKSYLYLSPLFVHPVVVTQTSENLFPLVLTNIDADFLGVVISLCFLPSKSVK